MFRCKITELQRLAAQRGIPFSKVRACIVQYHNAGVVSVDDQHRDYPRQQKGLGDHVADGLAAVGITKERVARWTGKRDCGCKKRQEMLNKLGQTVVDFVRGKDADQLDDQPH